MFIAGAKSAEIVVKVLCVFCFNLSVVVVTWKKGIGQYVKRTNVLCSCRYIGNLELMGRLFFFVVDLKEREGVETHFA